MSERMCRMTIGCMNDNTSMARNLGSIWYEPGDDVDRFLLSTVKLKDITEVIKEKNPKAFEKGFLPNAHFSMASRLASRCIPQLYELLVDQTYSQPEEDEELDPESGLFDLLDLIVHVMLETEDEPEESNYPIIVQEIML